MPKDLSAKTVPNSEVEIVGWQVESMPQIPQDAHIPTEVVRVRDKLYEVQGSGKPEDYEQFYVHAEEQRRDYLVVPDFTSDKHTKPTFIVLTQASEETEMSVQMFIKNLANSGVFRDYSSAVRSSIERTVGNDR